MSFFTNPLKVLKNTLNNLETWWTGTTIGQEVDTAASSAKTALSSLEPQILDAVTSAASAAMLPLITGGGTVASILSAGATAVEGALKSQAVTVAATAVSTFIATLHNSLTAQVAANSNTQAPTAAAS